jgi:hypothetical protein
LPHFIFNKTVSLFVVVVFLLLLLLGSSFLFLSSASAVSPNSVTKLNIANEAGYSVYDSTSSGSLSIKGTWVVPITHSCQESGTVEYYIEIETGVYQDGSIMGMYCSSIGATPGYYINYLYHGSHTLLPSKDKISAGDKMSTVVTFSSSTGKLSITIKDSTKGWTFASKGLTDTAGTGQAVRWDFYTSTIDSLPLKFTTLKTSGDYATMGGHSGTLGSFVSLSGYATYQYTDVDAPDFNEVLATTSAISSGTSFSITWVAFS